MLKNIIQNARIRGQIRLNVLNPKRQFSSNNVFKNVTEMFNRMTTSQPKDINVTLGELDAQKH